MDVVPKDFFSPAPAPAPVPAPAPTVVESKFEEDPVVISFLASVKQLESSIRGVFLFVTLIEIFV